MRSTSNGKDSSRNPATSCNMQQPTVEQQHAQSTCRKHRTTHLPPQPTLSNTRIHLRVVRSRRKKGENRKQHKRRRTSKKENVRLIVQPRTRTEKYSVPPVRPTAPARAPPARCSSPSHSFGCPGSGSISRRRRRGRNPGPVSWECRNTACAKKRGNTT